MASVCLFGLTGTSEAAASSTKKKTTTTKVHPSKPKVHDWDRKPGDHPKLDKKLNDRSKVSGTSRVIVEYVKGTDPTADLTKSGAKRGKKFNLINGELIEVSNSELRKLADSKAVKAMHHDRKTGGEMNRAAIVEGARAVQAAYGYDGAGVGVAIVDSGITSWHDDLTYQGSNPLVHVVGGQRVRKFVDFVNGQTTAYDDNGHGTHVAGIIAGNGYDTLGLRAGIAPAADLVSLKVLDNHGGGYISNVIAALDWIAVNRTVYNIRVVNLSVGAAVTESYLTDPLTLAAKVLVDQGVVVVTAAGNLGKNAQGQTQYGGITAPGNAPWVLTVGAYSHEGTIGRGDDKIAPYSSRGPTARDFNAKPDVVATGTGIVSLSTPGSLLYLNHPTYLLTGLLSPTAKPYLSLTGTSMAAPMVTGTVALMLQANPNLTPNLVKALIEYSAQRYAYNSLTQGAGFLNTKGAVDLAKFLKTPQAGQAYPHNPYWSNIVIWGNRKLQRGVIKPAGNAWKLGTTWGAAEECSSTNPDECDNIVWGTECDTDDCDNIVWGNSLIDTGALGSFSDEGDNIVWGTTQCGENVSPDECDNIVWGTACDDDECDNIVWGTSQDCDPEHPEECDNIVWGTSEDCDPDNPDECDNIVWGTAEQCDPDNPDECDNIVWGTSGEVGPVWGSSSEDDNITWGCAGTSTPLFDDPLAPPANDTTTVNDPVFATSFAVTPLTTVVTGTTSPTPPPALPPVIPPVTTTSGGGGF